LDHILSVEPGELKRLTVESGEKRTQLSVENSIVLIFACINAIAFRITVMQITATESLDPVFVLSYNGAKGVMMPYD